MKKTFFIVALAAVVLFGETAYPRTVTALFVPQPPVPENITNGGNTEEPVGTPTQGAGAAPTASTPTSHFQFYPIVSLPLVGQGTSLTNNTSINEYLAGVFRLAISVAAVLAVIMIVVDGFKYMTSEAIGNKKDALSGLRDALFGLVLLLASYLILFIINPSILCLSLFNPAGSSCTPPSGQGASSLPAGSLANSPGGATGVAAPGSSNSLGNSNYGEGPEWCFHSADGTLLCALSSSDCQMLHGQQSPPAKDECTQQGAQNQNGISGTFSGGAETGAYGSTTVQQMFYDPSLYTDSNGLVYSGNPLSIFYVGYGDKYFAYFPDQSYSKSGGKINAPGQKSREISQTPQGFTPDQIKKLYHLPQTGGQGTIAIIDPYNQPSLESDLAVFSKAFNLPPCTQSNGCLEVHSFATTTATGSSGWMQEIALDVEWAHAIAPTAKILLVSAADGTPANYAQAVDYAVKQPDVVSVSMSIAWYEWPGETDWDSHFASTHHVLFFSASGDWGHEIRWPAASPNVIAVGGTTYDSNTGAETAWGYQDQSGTWQGSGGGISQYETAGPAQAAYGTPGAAGKRGVPDVAFVACGPNDSGIGYATYINGAWTQQCGTSAGTPEWAALATFSNGLSLEKIYEGAASLFRDITTGQNGTCGSECLAKAGYDYLTGLGSPLTTSF